jgi:hypothetical protein
MTSRRRGGWSAGGGACVSEFGGARSRGRCGCAGGRWRPDAFGAGVDWVGALEERRTGRVDGGQGRRLRRAHPAAGWSAAVHLAGTAEGGAGGGAVVRLRIDPPSPRLCVAVRFHSRGGGKLRSAGWLRSVPHADLDAALGEPRADLRAASASPRADLRGRFCGPHPPLPPSDQLSRGQRFRRAERNSSRARSLEALRYEQKQAPPSKK